ncbi:nucleoside transporter C-terminal domain-containing protein [Halobacillus sp. ACCC02827]|uniref:NupC/NupG family nucleoside CNT transporter n=1 Tax=Halobacillus sp. ACCC02827 TaxID=3052090 RepID=UPI0025711E38|nr:nucleoside transporter C-terminal domain-containing protein [Halobacillus sp. ACCC02827]WJE15217.1 nucleoside transporter C-terminal domain-containing protein [Halobacillus sp. ACCC02827]
MHIFYGILSLIGLLFLAWLLSTNKKAIKWRTIVTGVALEGLFVYFMLNVPLGSWILEKAAQGVQHVLNYSREGIDFLFGGFFAEGTSVGFVFAIQVLSVIIFISALVSALYYLRIIPSVVRGLGWVVGKIFGTTRVESFNTVGNTMLGVAESPILIKPYLAKLTRSEMFTVMVGGTASASGAILLSYAQMGIDIKYLLISVFSVPFVTIVIAKLMEPETEESITKEDVSMEEAGHTNIFEAISEGAVSGVKLAANIGGLLIAFISILALTNGMLGIVGLDLATIFGYAFYPFAILVGIPVEDAFRAASIIGTKLTANELIAFQDVLKIQEQLQPQTIAILSVALCNFANLSTIGQLIVGLGSLAPSKKKQIASLSFKAIIAGTMASFITAIFVNMFI